MTCEQMLRSLDAMVAVKDGRVKRLALEMTVKEQARTRYRDRIDLIEHLGRTSVEHVDRCAAVLALNYAHYRQTVAQIVHDHRENLALQEKRLVADKGRLVAGALQRDCWLQARHSREAEFARWKATREQQQQDDTASLAWLHSRR